LNLCFGYHHVSFSIRSLGSLELFSNSPLSVIFRLSQGPASRLTIKRTIWSKWTQAWWSLLRQLNSEWFGCLFWGPASRRTLPRTIWSEWTRSEQSLLTCSKIPLGCLLRTFDIIINCAFHCIICIPTLCFLSFIWSTFNSSSNL
jgi:hypothetical protein